MASQTRQQESKCRHLHEQRDNALHDVIEMEVRMGIVNWWGPSTPEYQEMIKYLNTHEYQRALDNLQKLVILRLFELHKLNLSQTGRCLHH